MNEKNELIQKLEAISILHKKLCQLNEKVNTFVPEDYYERKIVVPAFPGDYEDDDEREGWSTMLDHSEDTAVEEMAELYDNIRCPKEPKKPIKGKRPEPEYPLSREYKQKNGWINLTGWFVGGCALLSGGLFYGDIATFVCNILIIGVCGYFIFRYNKKMKEVKESDEELTAKILQDYEKRISEQDEKYEQDMQEYQLEMDSFKLAKNDFMEAYVGWREIYLKSLEEEAEISDKLEADRLAAIEKIKADEMMPVAEEMVGLNDLVTNAYLPALDDIIDLLKNGRADDLKEAINLYEDIVYREKELKLQREKEAQRRYEEECRRQDEERRYQEEKRFRESQERQRQREEEQRRLDEERRHKEDMALRERQEMQRQNEARQQMRMQEKQHQDQMNFQKDQEMQRKREAEAGRQKRCAWCASYPSCGMINQEAAYNCTGFRPR